jgi:hypothetical protein
MKLFLILGSIVILHLSAFCQIETSILKPQNFIIIKPAKEVCDKSLTGNFIDGVVVVDNREDTMLLGYYTAANKKTYRLRFETSTATEMAHWMVNYMKLDSGKTDNNVLYVSLKKFILSTEITEKVFDNGHEGQAQNGWEEGVLAKMEFYLKKDNVFYPLYRFDSILVVNKKLQEKADEFITAILKISVAKLFALNFEVVLMKSRKLMLEDIMVYNSKTINTPILTQTEYKKGVYKTFDEFKNNTPSIKEFQFKKGSAGDILYVTENGQEYPERTAWGFCDGKDIFINSGDKYSQLVNQGRTFYFKGIKSIDRNGKHRFMKSSMLNLITNTGEKKTSYNMEYKYYMIDMETGEVY